MTRAGHQDGWVCDSPDGRYPHSCPEWVRIKPYGKPPGPVRYLCPSCGRKAVEAMHEDFAQGKRGTLT